MSKAPPVWVSAPQAADCPRLAKALGSLRHGLALREASGEPAGRGLSYLGFHLGVVPTLQRGLPLHCTARRR